MAEKRMFSKKIIDTDWFMDMPASTQNLYFHLSMRADDDGFVANPKRIIKLVGASEDDYKLLVAKRFVIVFESGICVITDWRINNYLRSDRYTETTYQEEKKMLILDDKGKYELGIPLGIPQVDPEYSLSNSNSNSIILNNNKEDINSVIESIENEDLKNEIREFIKMRNKIKKSLTPHALNLILKELNKITPNIDEQVLIVQQSIKNGWQGVFPLKEDKKQDSFEKFKELAKNYNYEE